MSDRIGHDDTWMTRALKLEDELRALRAALDAAERERDEARERGEADGDVVFSLTQDVQALRGQLSDVLAENDALRFTLNNVRLNDATGYARGVRDAAAILANNVCDLNGGKLIAIPERIKPMRDTVRGAYEDAILALLPDATKEKNDDR